MNTYCQLLLATAICLSSGVVSAQRKQVPIAVNEAFAQMFPAALHVEWREKTTNFTVFFTVNDRKCEAKYEKNGGWLSTEESLQWDSLPRPVRDSFNLSQYSDWQKISAYSLTTEVASTQFHLVVTKNNLGRRILFYTADGKAVTAP